MELILPAAEHKRAAIDFRQEFFNNGESSIDGSSGLYNANSYEFWLSVVEEGPTRVHERHAPASTYFAMVEDKIVGIVNIRHALNQYLINVGGHIGYSVRPSERRKGYATEILRLSLEKCRQLGIEKALVTCNNDNIGSEKTILKNGGVFESEFIEENGTIVLRHWIEIKRLTN